MSTRETFDPLIRFAEIERLVSKIYFRFSHLFFPKPELRDFWWEMAKEEEQHACILNACRAIIENYEDEKVDPSITLQKADALKEGLLVYLNKGLASIGVEEAFRIALEIESSEIDAIYGKLLQLGGPKIAKTMQNLGVPASLQRQKLKLALRQFCSNPELLQAAERL
jgi:rubrerythrin